MRSPTRRGGPAPKPETARDEVPTAVSQIFAPTTDSGQQVARIISIKIVARTRIVRVSCPLCGGEHVHGWPHSAVTIGSRASHCGRGCYRVPVPDEAGR